MKILIVDDTRTLRELLRKTLLGAGHEVAEAEDGAAGLDRYKEFKPELVITDLTMPIMNGIELTKEIRELPEAGSIPIFILTTETATDLKAQARQVGATGWMVKPFDPGRLLSVIGRYGA